MPHIVDTLIEERAPELIRRKHLWRALKPLLYPLLGYEQARAMADAIAPLSGHDGMRHLGEAVQLDVRCQGQDRVPRRGLTVAVANHPSGIADGIAVFEALRHVRSDITFFANRDAIRVSPGMADVIVPVEWMAQRRDLGRRRETVRGMVRAFREQRLIVIFPSGRLARPTLHGLVERDWEPTALNLALKYRAPVMPLHVTGRNSWLYYLFYAMHDELRDMTLFRELLNKRGRTYHIEIAEPFQPQGNPRALTAALQHFVSYRLPRGETRFNPPGTVPPASPDHQHNS